jgi:hypothetical protein
MMVCAPVGTVQAEEGDLMAPAVSLAEERREIDREIVVVETLLLSGLKQAKYEMRHSFAPGIYLREIKMFAGTELIGAEHLTEHFNFVLTGKALVKMAGRTEAIEAPCYFKSGESVRKMLCIIEDMRWVTVHANPNNLRDLKELWAMIARKSAVHQRFEQLIQEDRFRAHGAQFKPAKEEISL